ncbi:hypothetical protein P3T22_004880 [Paraburkholderia sp. GAS348]
MRLAAVGNKNRAGREAAYGRCRKGDQICNFLDLAPPMIGQHDALPPLLLQSRRPDCFANAINDRLAPHLEVFPVSFKSM